MTALHADAWLFDLDGTLVDSTASVVRTWLTWAREFDIDPARLVGGHGRRTAQVVASVVEPALVEQALRRIDDLEMADAVRTRAIPGAADLVARLPLDRWAIVTSSSRALALARLEAAGLPTGAAMITADEVSNGKPDPEPYLRGAALLGHPASRCVVVEDAPAGIAAARAARSAVIGILSTHDRARLDADLVVTDLRDIDVSGDGPFEIDLTAARNP